MHDIRLRDDAHRQAALLEEMKHRSVLRQNLGEQFMETGFAGNDHEVPYERLANSPEWKLPRCSSAVFMTLELNPTAGNDKWSNLCP